MKLRVQYTAQLRTIAGRSEEEIELPEGSSLATLLGRLAADRNELASHLITPSGEGRPSLLVVINGQATAVRAADAIPLQHGDVVMLLPPIAGG
jgi:MoaD family protein